MAVVGNGNCGNTALCIVMHLAIKKLFIADSYTQIWSSLTYKAAV